MEYTITIPEDLLDTDLTALNDDLSDMLESLHEVHIRVQALINTNKKLDDVARTYRTAVEGSQPDLPPEQGDVDLTDWLSWSQPVGPHDAYPAEWVVQHEDELWRNTRFHNSMEPGSPDCGWENVTPIPSPPEEPVEEPEDVPEEPEDAPEDETSPPLPPIEDEQPDGEDDPWN